MTRKTRVELEHELHRLRERIKELEAAQARVSSGPASPAKIEEQYRGIFEASRDAFLIFDLGSVIRQANPAACAMYGYRCKELIGLTGKQIVHPDYQHLFQEFVNKASQGETFQAESVDVRKDGSSFNVEVRGGGLTYRGEPHLLAIVRDVTKRKQTEQQLRHLNSLLGAISEVNQLAVKEQDQHALMQGTCDILQQTGSYQKVEVALLDREKGRIAPVASSGEHSQRNWELNFEGEDSAPACIKECLRARQALAMESEQPLCSNCRCLWENTRQHMVIVPLIQQDEPAGFLSVARGTGHKLSPEELSLLEELAADLSMARAKCQGQEKLRETERVLRAIAENSRDIVCLHGADHTYTYVSPASKEILGWEPEQLVGTSPWTLVHPEDLGRLRESSQEMASGDAPVLLSCRIRKRSGEYVWLESTSRSLKDDTGRIQGFVTCSRDVTERKKMSQQAEFFANALLRSTQPFCIGYTDGRIRQPNHAYCQLLGYTREEVERLDWRADLTPAEWQKVSDEHLERAMKTRQPQHFEEQFLRKDGARIDADVTIHPVFDDKGRFLYQYTFLTDITAYKRQTERAEFLASLLERSSQPFVVADGKGRFVLANSAFCRLVGYSHQEVRELSLHQLTPAKWQQATEEAYRRAYAEQCPVRYEKEYRRKDGSLVPVELLIELDLDEEGNVQHRYAFCTDITERKEAEERLQQSEQTYRFLAENMGDIVWLMDLNFNTEYVSPSITRILGFTPEERKRQTLADMVTPESRKNIMSTLQQQLAKEAEGKADPNRILTVEVEHYHKDGSVVLTENRIRAQRNKEGVMTGIYGITRDITESRKTEERIKYISFHDSLTGLYNRAYMEEEMRRLNTERQQPISIIMADVNDLKLVNDTFGHELGDEMLKCTADVFRTICRAEDIIARWGGDEFLILLPQAGKKEANAICKRIQDECQRRQVERIPSSIAMGSATTGKRGDDLTSVLKKAEDNMYRRKFAANQNGKSTILATLLAIAKEKSLETEEHTERMTGLAAKMGERIGLAQQEQERLSLAISLHDVGRVTIPEEVLKREGNLTARDWQTIKRHPETGYRIARATKEFASVAEDILAHHEYWDGSGYPQGLKREKIPLLARIISIVDTYSAMTHPRPYRKTKSPREAIVVIRERAGSQFDPDLVETFMEIIQEELGS